MPITSLSVRKICDKMSMKFFPRAETIKKKKKRERKEIKISFFLVKIEINVCQHSNWKFSEFKNEIVSGKEYRVSGCPISWLGKSGRGKKKKKKFKAGQATMADETRASRNDCPGHIVEFWHCSDATINKRKKEKKKKQGRKKRQKLSHKLQFGCRARGWMFCVSNGEGVGHRRG